jgi:hypothetical protein
MKHYILIDNKGNIIGDIESNDPSLIVDENAYVEITKHPLEKELLERGHEYKVTKNAQGKASFSKLSGKEIEAKEKAKNATNNFNRN